MGSPCGGVQALEGKTGAQPESLTSPRSEAENANSAPCDHSSASRLGPEAARVPSGPALAALVPASQARWCGSNCASASVARALPWGDDGWGTVAATPSCSWHPREPLPSRAERSEGSGFRGRGFAGSAGKRRICLQPPEQRSRRGGCLFPPGPSAEALRPPPPAPPRSGSSAPDSRSSALGCRQAGGTNPPTSPARGGGGEAGAKTGRVRGGSSAPSARALGAGPGSGARGSGESRRQ